ncbi:MAG: polysaccharide deacetylase family protein [Armatimonadota bacterium]
MARRCWAALLAVAFGLGASTALGEPRAPSHLSAHTAAQALSHLGAHRPGLPPEALLVPLGNGSDGVLKGMTLVEEEMLAEALTHQELRQTVLRVAAAQAAGSRMALIKLQAGTQAGEFSLADLRADAVRCLRAAFNVALGFDHLDLWSVVPGAEMVGDEQEHLPVFSLSLSREDYAAAAQAAGHGPELIDALDGVRYSPMFTRYAVDGAGAVFPDGTFTDAALGESWSSLLEEAGGDLVAGMMRAQTQISAIFHGRRESNLVALTIDDGPHPLVTPLMLAILKREGVRATFFVVGQKVEQFPALARMALRGGHELANHAYSNRRLHTLSDQEAWAEIAACRRVVDRVTGAPMRFFRPPGGRCSPGGLRAMASLGYTAAFWSRNTGDWRKPPAALICRNATEGLQPGDVILMHQGELCSVEALPLIIARVRAMGLEPTTLAAVADSGGVIAGDPVSISGMVNGQLGEE